MKSISDDDESSSCTYRLGKVEQKIIHFANNHVKFGVIN